MTSIPQKILDLMLQSQYWPSADLQAFQRTQLGQLLKHTYEKSPFYKDRLKLLFDHNGDIDWNRWTDVPIIKRVDLRDHGKEMLVGTLPPLHEPVKEFHTSGSSGVPVSVTYGPIFSMVAQAARSRAFTWHGIDYSKPRARLSMATASGEPIREDFFLDTWGPFWTPKQTHGREVVINRALTTARQLKIMAEQRIRYLSAFPNSVELLARVNERQKQQLKLDYIFAYGQGVSEEQLALFDSSFGAKCLQTYSSKEGGKIAFKCPEHNNFHINSETVMLEVIDEQDRPCSFGTPGRIVITPFYNSAQPLVRYEQGDVGVLGEVCPCGRTLPVLQKILGRAEPIWKFPDGMLIAPRLRHTLLQEKMHALAYQIAHIAPMELEVRYIPTAKNAKPEEATIQRHILEMTRPDITISFKPMDSLPINSGGKTQLFTAEIGAYKK
jgi:phenylacetate-CoA ligase